MTQRGRAALMGKQWGVSELTGALIAPFISLRPRLCSDYFSLDDLWDVAAARLARNISVRGGTCAYVFTLRAPAGAEDGAVSQLSPGSDSELRRRLVDGLRTSFGVRVSRWRCGERTVDTVRARKRACRHRVAAKKKTTKRQAAKAAKRCTPTA